MNRVDGPPEAAATPLAALFSRMRSPIPDVAEDAWGQVYRRYHQRVWARVYYVIRTIPWLREPREVSSDVAAQVFLGLPAALARYRDMGRPEQWLLRVALRTALRHKETLTGNWVGGERNPRGSRRAEGRPRSFLDLNHAVDEISHLLEEVELDERLELQRRLEKWRHDPEKTRWLQLIQLFLEGYGHDEIGERLGISSGTSRTWLWQIRQALSEPPDLPGMGEEVRGRDGHEAGDAARVIPIGPGAGPHPAPEVLNRFADGVLAPAEDAAAAGHVAMCRACAEQVAALRRGLAVLALGSEPPAALPERVRAGRSAGTLPLLPVDPSDAGEDQIDLVVGRGEISDPKDPADGSGTERGE